MSRGRQRKGANIRKHYELRNVYENVKYRAFKSVYCYSRVHHTPTKLWPLIPPFIHFVVRFDFLHSDVLVSNPHRISDSHFCFSRSYFFPLGHVF